MTAVLEDLRDLDLEGLAAVYRQADDETGHAILSECDRRDRAERRDRAARQLRDEWYNAMHAQYLQCHQRKDGKAAGGYTLLSTVRQALEIERSPCGPERTLKVLKSNVMPDTGNEGLTFTITGSAPRTRVQWAWNVRKIGSGSSSTEQVLTVLRLAGQPVTAQYVAARTGLKYPHVRVMLGRLIRRGEVRSAGRNAYAAAGPDGSNAESAAV